ncbi:hypothetical protein PENSPDRAFT_747943 [Peniophora sp. CONT]|nr:hypothetical protein PENSPDRAFT_747943 [Peniophora sp. CONT]
MGYTLTILPLSTITDDCSPGLYNSTIHSGSDLDSLRELRPDLTLEKPSWTLDAYSNYATLVSSSQHIPPEDCHTITLPRIIASEMVDLQTSFLFTGKVRDAALDDLEEAILSVPSQRAQVDHAFPLAGSGHRAWFIRMSSASPKDSPEKMPVRSLRQMLRTLCTSRRVQSDIDFQFENSRPVQVFLRPWDPEMREGAVEFRAFVPPAFPIVGQSSERGPLRISAISQYVWHKPFPSRFDLRQTADIAVRGAHELLPRILECAREAGVLEGVKKAGISFDVIVRDGECQLIEVNPFGSMSGCGSCLFQWVRDVRLLYGLEEKLEVRVLA